MNVTPACSNFQDCEDPLATISGNSISVYYSLDLNVRLKSNPLNPALQMPKSVGGILGIFPSTRRVPYGGWGSLQTPLARGDSQQIFETPRFDNPDQ